MDKAKLIRTIESALCVLFSLALAAAAISIYVEGTAAKALDPDAWIFTRDAAAARLIPAGILLACILAVAVWAHAAGVKSAFFKTSAKPAVTGRVQNRETTRTEIVVRAVLIALAVFMIVAGVMNGSMQDVLYKAINICTECVGLG